FAKDYIFPVLKAGAIYEKDYLLGTATARPLIARKQVEIALATGCDALAHGCTGKGNDQVRFELAYAALAPELKVIAPWREWTIVSREDAIDYAAARGIPVPVTKKDPYSRDRNLWHLSHEGGPLEDPAFEPEASMFKLTADPTLAPDEPEKVTITFESGVPVAVNGAALSPAKLIETLNAIGGRHGHVETLQRWMRSRIAHLALFALLRRSCIVQHARLRRRRFRGVHPSLRSAAARSQADRPDRSQESRAVKLWGGRFEKGPLDLLRQFNDSFSFDHQLLSEDIDGSVAWAYAIADAGVLTRDEARSIVTALSRIQPPVKFNEHEDVHSYVESKLREAIGPLAGKLHTGRSRNDQVATDLKLWLKRACDEATSNIRALALILVQRAEAEAATPMPGYTHSKQAEPITFGHWCLAYVEMLQRDIERF